MQRNNAGDDGGDYNHKPARGMTRNVVVARVRDQVVGDDVNRSVRHHRRRGSSGDHQRNKRSRSERH